MLEMAQEFEKRLKYVVNDVYICVYILEMA